MNGELANSSAREAETVFNVASGLKHEERSAYLDRVCGRDVVLRCKVEDLLEAHDDIGAFLPDSPRAPATLAVHSVDSEKPGDRISHYRLMEKLGEGGMGVVYLAEQEAPVSRKVALKIIKLGMDTRQVVARFEAERQALALMDHPHIAKILDAGATENGRPFFVMELVQGVPMTEFCEKNRLSIEERLKLFIPVCQAIQSAHQKGVIHRDIKPSNVLVRTNPDGSTHPVVIDFGVAKAIDQKLTEKTLFTNFATMIGTPAYMSPEQAEMSGLDIDTRSDIYSLGVLLYELLTGSTPFPEKRLRSVPYAEMQRIILHQEPDRPSTRLKCTLATADPTQLEIANRKSQIDWDLDWIVLKCLEKDRNRRYETANGLAAEIKRFLNSEPVMARPPSSAYRFQKAIRRNRFAFAAGGALALTLLTGVGVSSWQVMRATRAERTAQEEASNSKAVKDFLIEQVLAVSPYVAPEPDPGRRATLERVLRAAGTAFANRPEIEAELRFAAGIGFIGLADPTRAAAEFERAHAIRERVLGPQDSDTLWALAAIAQTYQILGRTAEGQALLTEPLAMIRRSPHPWSSGEAEVVWTYGVGLDRSGHSLEALPLVQEAMEVSRRTMDAKDFRLWNKVMYLAAIFDNVGRVDEAEAMLLDGLRRCQQIHSAEHTLTLQFEKLRSDLLLERGRWPEALTNLQRIVPIYHRILGTNHNNALDAEGLLAEAWEKQGSVEKATELYVSLYPRWAKRLPYDKARIKFQQIAAFFVRHRDYEQARTVFRLLADSFAQHPPQNASEGQMQLQATAATEGWPAASVTCRNQTNAFEESLSLWLNKAWVFRYVGDQDSYQQVVTKVLGLAPNLTSKSDQLMPIEIAALGSFRFSSEQIQQLDSMVAAWEATISDRSTNQRAWGYSAIGQLQLQLGRLDQCLEALAKAESQQSGGDPCTFFIRAMCLHRLNRREEARMAFEAGESLLKLELQGPLGELENFLPAWQIYQQVLLRREAAALLGVNSTAPREHPPP